MPQGIRYALVYASKRKKVLAFESMEALCRRIHRAREGGAIQLEDGRLLFQGETDERQVVTVYALDDAGMKQGFLGHAWLDGGKRPALQSALYSVQPETTPHAVAA